MRTDSMLAPILSRRRAVQIGVGTVTGLALGGAPHPSLAQALPSASPTAGGSHARPEMLIDADWVLAHQDDPSVVLVGFMPAEDFAEGHIPGSVQLDWPVLEVIDTSDASIEGWRDQTVQTLSSLGITRDHTVVAYDAGTLFAARLWWVLHYLGHDDTRVLNGGLAAWQQVTGEVITDAPPTALAASLANDSYQVTQQPDVLAQLDAVWASLYDPEVTIIDARTPEEYAEGHIPGAVNINYPRNALADAPKFWKPADELRAMYEAVGVSSEQRVIPYCSTGVRSAVTWFTLRLIGYEDVALYTGSWKEWGDHPETPKTGGDQP
jgi:thiosulfate/3-mercaptopyruvate sulfurtransferase